MKHIWTFEVDIIWNKNGFRFWKKEVHKKAMLEATDSKSIIVRFYFRFPGDI
jgi:hypothetical protein